LIDENLFGKPEREFLTTEQYSSRPIQIRGFLISVLERRWMMNMRLGLLHNLSESLDGIEHISSAELDLRINCIFGLRDFLELRICETGPMDYHMPGLEHLANLQLSFVVLENVSYGE
jgi:hypothetical protein